MATFGASDMPNETGDVISTIESPIYWRPPRYGEHFRTCSFCGSIHPDDLAREDAWTPDWADRKYGWPHKFYTAIPNRNQSTMFVVATATNNDEPIGFTYTWHHVDDMTPMMHEVLRRCNMHSPSVKWVAFSHRDRHRVKFYTSHLTDDLTSATRERLQRMCGLKFTFVDNIVSWAPYGT